MIKRLGMMMAGLLLLVAFLCSGCSTPQVSRPVSFDLKGKTYEAQIKGDGGGLFTNLTFLVNGKELGTAKFSALSPSATMVGNLDDHLFEALCNEQITANGWGKSFDCDFYANKKKMESVKF